mmetsp:Transcript_3358/g.7506  ORF Transcript_3358/g.7506 Transcript_3358/m.7506 type:complete len:333 (+) Transcript_3358:996-1994(+)
MLSILSIPRLVVHRDEVDKIFNPKVCQSKRSLSLQKVAPSATNPTIQSGTDDGARPPSKISITLDQLSCGLVEFVELPYTMSHKWRGLAFLMLVLCFGSYFSHILSLFFPLASVDAGLPANRSFLYGVMTYHEFLGLLPWVGTCNYAMPKGTHSLSVRITAVIVGMVVAKIFGAFVAEGWWSGGQASPVFPIPFSVIATGTVAFPFVMIVLWFFNPERKSDKFRSTFRLCLILLTKYVFIMFVAGLWAVVFRLLMGTVWQKVWTASSFSLLKFVCKILLLSHTVTKLSPARWIILAFVCDLIFARVQVATLPYVDDILSIILVLLPNWGTLL